MKNGQIYPDESKITNTYYNSTKNFKFREILVTVNSELPLDNFTTC